MEFDRRFVKEYLVRFGGKVFFQCCCTFLMFAKIAECGICIDVYISPLSGVGINLWH